MDARAWRAEAERVAGRLRASLPDAAGGWRGGLEAARRQRAALVAAEHCAVRALVSSAPARRSAGRAGVCALCSKGLCQGDAYGCGDVLLHSYSRA